MTQRRERVRQLYEVMPYPRPIQDLKPHLAGEVSVCASPNHFYHLLWPRRPYQTGLRILSAGCGTSQAAVLAALNPGCNVTGIDISERCLDCTQALARKHSLSNLTLRHLPIEDAASLDQKFDLIFCTGVLHHLPNPDSGLSALADVLADDGVMQVMVYGKYGRAGLYLMQEYCKRLRVQINIPELDDLRMVLQTLCPKHPLLQYATYYRDSIRQDEELADSFLHPLDGPFTVPDIYAWIERCGLVLRRWCPQGPYMPRYSPLAETPHLKRILALPEPEQHALMELYRGTISTHQFLVCKKTVSPDSYAMDFTADAWRRYVPIPRTGLVFRSNQLPSGVAMQVAVNRQELETHPVSLSPFQMQVAAHLRVQQEPKSVAQIMKEVSSKGESDAEDEAFRELFRSFWELDIVFFCDLH